MLIYSLVIFAGNVNTTKEIFININLRSKRKYVQNTIDTSEIKYELIEILPSMLQENTSFIVNTDNWASANNIH